MRIVGFGSAFCVLLLTLESFQTGQTKAIPSEFVSSAQCAACHPRIYETYQRTGMGRSFFKAGANNKAEDYSRQNAFYHRASDRYYTMTERAGAYFQKRYQKGPDGKEINVVEE